MKNALSYSLSGEDLKQLNPRTNLYLYEDVKNFLTIDHLLHPHGSAIILYEWNRTPDCSIGHYISVIKLPDGGIEHFDSYAIKPDDELKQIQNKSDAFKNMTGQDQKYLLRLYINTHRNVSYNHHRLQSLNNDISTCGRFAVLRTIYKHLTLEQFIDLFKNNSDSADVVAVRLTQNI